MAEDNCPECQGELVLNEKYDAYYCTKCNEWRSPACGDETCSYCTPRPPKPSDATQK